MILIDADFASKDSSRRIEPKGDERRRSNRAPADFVVEIETVGREKWRAWAVDIGLGGMFIESDAVPPYASVVLITIREPALRHPIRIPATVRWSTTGGFGVQFDLLGIRETHALVSLTSELSRYQEEAVTIMRMHLCS